MAREFGFGPDRLDLSGLDQSGKAFSSREQSIADRAAERAGFQVRDPIERVARKRKAAQPHDQAFVRAPIEVINRFKQFCNETGLNYGEALDELMRRSGC